MAGNMNHQVVYLGYRGLSNTLRTRRQWPWNDLPRKYVRNGHVTLSPRKQMWSLRAPCFLCWSRHTRKGLSFFLTSTLRGWPSKPTKEVYKLKKKTDPTTARPKIPTKKLKSRKARSVDGRPVSFPKSGWMRTIPRSYRGSENFPVDF